MPWKDRETRYGGLTVSEEEMQCFKSQPAGEFLNFKKKKNHEYIMSYKIPDHGKVTLTKEDNREIDVNIRKCTNMIFKYMAKTCVDKKGNVHTSTLDHYLLNDAEINAKPGTHPMLDMLGIPEKDKPELNDFLSALVSASGSPAAVYSMFLVSFQTQMNNLNAYSVQYQRYLNMTEEERKNNPEFSKYVIESYGDYIRECNDLIRASKMNPEKETEFLGYMDCEKSALFNKAIARMLSRPGAETEGAFTSIPMPQKIDTQAGYADGRFTHHCCFTTELKMPDGSNKILSLETTAPPSDRFLFRGKNGKNGVGLYESIDALKNYHVGKNAIPRLNTKELEGMKSPANPQYREQFGINKPLQGRNKDFEKQMMEKIVHRYIGGTPESVKLYDLSLKNRNAVYDDPVVKSSPEFKAMKYVFERYEKYPSEIHLKTLQVCAKDYLCYKLSDRFLGVGKKPSEYAKRRIDLAMDIYNAAGRELAKVKEQNKQEKINQPVMLK